VSYIERLARGFDSLLLTILAVYIYIGW